MDSNHNEIEHLREDMGEGFKEPINERENKVDKDQRRLWRLEERLRRKGAK